MNGTERPLIVDLGAHDGSDTGFYLAKGFDVLAVEASPNHAAQLRERFATDIEAGRLLVVEAAVADHEGTIDFFLSDQDLWASTDADMASRGIQGVHTRSVTVPCTTLDRILLGQRRPYYVKIDVEGRDPDCIEALGRVPNLPTYVSFEADLTDADEVSSMLDLLEMYGYDSFKLVNQATHHLRTLPHPPREGRYVKAKFDKHSSGPFGEESPGWWRSRAEVELAYRRVLQQQAARIEYSATGRVFGIPMSWSHGVLIWLYNLNSVERLRQKWADWREVEMGGWFDIHARLGDTVD